MQIDEIGSNKKGGGIDSQSQQEEIRRMAQSMAAERMAASQASAGQAQPIQGNAERQQDAVKLSDKALSSVSARNGPDTMNRRDQLFNSIMDTINNELENPGSDFNRKNQQAGGAGDKKKNKKVEEKKEWTPSAHPGQIHEGREVIGKIKVTREVKEEEGPAGVGAVGQAGAGKANSKSGAGDSAQKPARAKSGAESQDKKQQSKNSEKGSGSKEAKEASAAQSMEKPGMKADGMQEAGAKKSKEQSVEGSGVVGEFDVRGRAFGTTQTLTLKPAGELKPGEGSLGTFRRLDDKPMLKYVTLESKNTTDAVKEMKKNAKAAGESPDAIARAAQQLKDKSQPDS